MEADDFYVVVVENDKTGDTASELKLTVIDVSDEVVKPEKWETILKDDNNVPSNESKLIKIDKEEIELLFEVIDDIKQNEERSLERSDCILLDIKLEELPNDNCNTFSEDNVTSDYLSVKVEVKNENDHIDVKKEDLTDDNCNEFWEKSEIEFRDKNFNSLLQIECPRKRAKRIFNFFKDTLLKNERRVIEPLDMTLYSYYGDCYICKYCDHSTSNEKTAMKHYQFRHGPRIFICLACKTAYRRHDCLISHEKVCVSEYSELLRKARQSIGSRQAIRSKDKQVKTMCPSCGKLVPRRNLKKHLDIHKGVYYECDECGSRFLSKHSLVQHFYKHRTLTPYQCDQCDRFYTSARGLKRHELDHGSEAYVCDVCGRNFLRQGSLTQHIKINHTDYNYILCQLCGKSYKQKTSFRRHQCEPWKNVPIYQCMKCNKRFLKESVFKKHLNKKHGLDTSKLFLDPSTKPEKIAMYTVGNTSLRKFKKNMSIQEEDLQVLTIADE